jgi:hypothetical protein
MTKVPFKIQNLDSRNKTILKNIKNCKKKKIKTKVEPKWEAKKKKFNETFIKIKKIKRKLRRKGGVKLLLLDHIS